jgi:hypothetical protein
MSASQRVSRGFHWLGLLLATIPLLLRGYISVMAIPDWIRENLNLRRELAGEVAKAERTRVPVGMAYRLGWVLYWACLGLAVFWLAVWVGRFFTDLAPLPSFLHVLLFLLPAVALYGLSHALGYVLSAGE